MVDTTISRKIIKSYISRWERKQTKNPTSNWLLYYMQTQDVLIACVVLIQCCVMLLQELGYLGSFRG
jgi:hypothetical protein